MAAAFWRLGSALMLVQTFLTDPGDVPQVRWVIGSILVYCIGSALSYVVRRRVGRRQAAFDLGFYLLAMATAAWVGLPGGSNVLYGHLVMGVLVLGLAPWRWWTATLIGLTVAVCLAVTIDNPLRWNIPPDAMVLWGNVLLGWFVANTVRTAASRLDHARTQAITEAAEAGRLTQLSMYATALRSRVLATLEHVRETGIADERLSAQVSREINWLRGHLAPQPPADDTTVLATLQRVCAAKTAEGLHIRLNLAGHVLHAGQDAGVTAAVDLAVTEALSNVAKHSGTDTATVSAVDTPTGPVITIADTGSGFEPTATRRGIGLRDCVRAPLAEAGGYATVISSPGEGTVVTLHLPRQA